MGISAFLAFKYLRPKRSVASVITIVSILGVLLGIAVVVIVRSVMTGFGDTWREKILDFKPHVTIMGGAGSFITDEESVSEKLRAIPGVTSVNPEIISRVMVSANDRVLAPVLIGIGGDDIRKAYSVGEPLAGTFDLEPGGIIIGYEVAWQLRVGVGSTVTVCAPPLPDEVFLPRKWKVTGVFRSGQHDYDSDFVIADLDSVRDLVGAEEGVSTICLKAANPMDDAEFPRLLEDVYSTLRATGRRFRVMDWKEADRQIFNALAIETNMTALLLSLISLVALFCVMNTLLVLTVQKTPEIGLLKALGFGKLRIMGVFLVHGLVQCTAGVVLGLLASWAILSNLQKIVEFLGRCGMQVFPAEVYKLSEIPHRIVPSDVVWAVVLIYVFGIMASLIPALIAASKDPVRALNE